MRLVGDQGETPRRGRPLRSVVWRAQASKGHYRSTFRSVFGHVPMRVRRFHACPYQPEGPMTVPALFTRHPPIAPELRYLTSKLAALMPFRTVATVLMEVLPLSSTAHAMIGRALRAHSVTEAMTIEHGSLRPLATERFDLQEVSFPTVDGAGCVRVKTNPYSVPAPVGTCVEAKLGPGATAGRRLTTNSRWTGGVVGRSLSSPGRTCWQASLDVDPPRQPVAQDDARLVLFNGFTDRPFCSLDSAVTMGLNEASGNE